MTVFDATKEGYVLTKIDQQIVLFTNMRLDRTTVPDGYFCYDIQNSNKLDGCMTAVKPYVMVNHWGTILSKEPFLLDKKGSYYPNDWEYLNVDMSFAEFAAAKPEQIAILL